MSTSACQCVCVWWRRTRCGAPHSLAECAAPSLRSHCARFWRCTDVEHSAPPPTPPQPVPTITPRACPHLPSETTHTHAPQPFLRRLVPVQSSLKPCAVLSLFFFFSCFVIKSHIQFTYYTCTNTLRSINTHTVYHTYEHNTCCPSVLKTKSTPPAPHLPKSRHHH